MTLGSVNPSRRLPSLIDAFIDYAEPAGVPYRFRRWVAITAIAGALERKVWLPVRGTVLFPNMYTVLVGPPGIGKTMSTKDVSQLWGELTDHHVSRESLTAASLTDVLAASVRRITRPTEIPNFIEFHSIKVLANELGVLVPGYDSEFMNNLTDIYDGHGFGQSRRGKDLRIKIAHPQITLLAGTTPSYLNSIMPPGAWDQGFISRVMLIFSGEMIKTRYFDVAKTNASLWDDIVHDFKHVGEDLYGKFTITDEAVALLYQWQDIDFGPVPDPPLLANYISRRPTHFLKLCMVAAIDVGDKLEIGVREFQRAQEWLLEAEGAMGDIFLSMAGTAGDARAADSAWLYCMQIYAKEKKPIPEGRLVGFLMDKVASHSIHRVIEHMASMGTLTAVMGDNGKPAYKPNARTGLR